MKQPEGEDDMLNYTRLPGEGVDRPPGGVAMGGMHMMETEKVWELPTSDIERGYVEVNDREPLLSNLNEYKQWWSKPKNPEDEDYSSLSEFEEKWERGFSKGFLTRPPFSVER